MTLIELGFLIGGLGCVAAIARAQWLGERRHR